MVYRTMTIDYEFLQNLVKEGKLIEALRCAVALMQGGSPGINVWFELANICLQLGERKMGIDGLTASGREYADGGNVDGLKDFVARLYDRDSRRIRHRMMPVPPLPATADEKDLAALKLDKDFLLAEAGKILTAADETAKLEKTMQERQSPVPYFPLFSSLSRENFLELAACFGPRRFYRDEIIIRQGEPARDLHLIASGEVKVFIAEKLQDEAGRTAQMSFKNIATLGPGTFIGEMGIVAKTPRSASVQATSNGMLLSAQIEAIEELAAKIPEVADIIVAYCEVRLLENVMAASPVLLPIDTRERAEALRLFDRIYAPAGDVIIHEGEAAKGIYIIVSGEAGVTKMATMLPVISGRDSQTGSMIYITTLTSGDVAGEISTVMKKPATATVHAITDVTLLFLPKDRFMQFTKAYPGVFQKLYEIVSSREDDIAKILRSSPSPADDLLV
jgi:CRP-like cAMP-binding protein